MSDERQLHRSRNALIGGVCAGVADYFNVDPLVVRIVTVVLTLISGGLLGVAYAGMWIAVPKEPRVVAPLDVKPERVSSDTYGVVDADAARTQASHVAGSAYVVGSGYVSAAHEPPVPPAAVAEARVAAASQAWGATADAPSGASGQAQPTESGWPMGQVTAPSPYDGRSDCQRSNLQPSSDAERPSGSVKAALAVGSFLLFFGVTAMVGMFVEGVSWWQYWPLIFMILGIVRMVVPGQFGHRARCFVNGVICFSAGGTLLLMSLGILDWQSLALIFTSLWPLLLMMMGLFLLSNALKSPWMDFLAGLCFVAFCVVGIVWYSVPGGTEQIVFMTPYGREYFFYQQP